MYDLYPQHHVQFNPHTPCFFVALGTLMLCASLIWGFMDPFTYSWIIIFMYAILFLGLATLYQLNNIVIMHHN